MNETMNIRFGPDMSMTSVEVITPELETIQQFALSAGDELEVEVPSRDSFIRLAGQTGRNMASQLNSDFFRQIPTIGRVRSMVSQSFQDQIQRPNRI